MQQSLLQDAKELIQNIQQVEMEQQSFQHSKAMLESSIAEYQTKLKNALEEYEVNSNAVKLLQSVSSSSVQESYRFIETNINEALKRIFPDRVRTIKLEESSRGNYPQLELSLIVENGVKRSLSDNSGHGIAQVVSALCTLCLIVIRGARRLVVLDEVTSGMDRDTRAMFEQIMWDFSTIGFQFIAVEHGFTPPKGAHVIHFIDGGYAGKEKGIAIIDKEYIEGVTGNTSTADDE